MRLENLAREHGSKPESLATGVTHSKPTRVVWVDVKVVNILSIKMLLVVQYGGRGGVA